LEQVLDASPDWIVKDLESVKLLGNSETGAEIEITNAINVS
jgi:hypothetical protein